MESPAHRFGQIIGDVLESAMLPVLQEFAKRHDLYLDKKGPRPCRSGRKCRWVDFRKNAHDLDYVLERGGGPTKMGAPVAFIETAWRRYTKHSRAKAQEIQGAIEPLAATYQATGPFKGAVLAGVFTDGALTQLKSHGFTILFFSTEDVVAVFAKYGIDADSDESTPDSEFQKKVDAYDALSARKKRNLERALVDARKEEVEAFVAALERTVLRQIERVVILALHGVAHEATTIDDAIAFVADYEDGAWQKAIEKYEIEVRYNTGDRIAGSFRDKTNAIEFLRSYQPIAPRIG